MKITCIKNIPEDYLLITDSQEVQATLEYIGKPELREDYQGLFVQTKNSDYTSIYAFCGTVPYLSKLVTKIM